MQKYEQIAKLNPPSFRRQTGVKPTTFEKMIKILREAEEIKKSVGGKPNKICLEDRLLMSLEYLREYRTYFHIANSYGISESTCYRNCVWIEDTLIKSKEFRLPGKKALLESENEFEIILVDATETPIERPKKK